jgi:hypothetical protein
MNKCFIESVNLKVEKAMQEDGNKVKESKAFEECVKQTYKEAKKGCLYCSNTKSSELTWRKFCT